MTLNNFAYKYQDISFNTTTTDEIIDTLLDDVNELLENLSQETNIEKLYSARDIINHFNIEIQSKTTYSDKAHARDTMDRFSIKMLRFAGDILDKEYEINMEADMEYIRKKLDELRQP
ncbi:hypothetical protein NHF50_10530 [Flavobacterium sp. NRK F10]|uniref:hypothetical protein n=1 Tax=Flavobacterium sp. NRK F10 TaxID=2954931 RepID=UPI0020910AC9|nr:hypothetical protein [Flavobacterium sp. NRK F10]MCO6175479.1 hypothetical protein [Flavobacterium sp. NRK F10]